MREENRGKRGVTARLTEYKSTYGWCPFGSFPPSFSRFSLTPAHFRPLTLGVGQFFSGRANSLDSSAKARDTRSKALPAFLSVHPLVARYVSCTFPPSLYYVFNMGKGHLRVAESVEIVGPHLMSTCWQTGRTGRSRRSDPGSRRVIGSPSASITKPRRTTLCVEFLLE